MNPERAAPRVLVIGAASRDVTGDDPRGWRLGGAVAYASLALARFGLRVRALIGADRDAARATELQLLRGAGVEIGLAMLESGPIFQNVEEAAGRRQVALSVAAPIGLERLPPGWVKAADAVFLGPVAGELPDDWALALRGRLVALGWQGLLRSLSVGAGVVRRPPAATPLVRVARLAGLSRDDVPAGTTPESLLPLLARGSTLAMTEADRGGVVVRGGLGGASALARRYRAIPSDGVVDPTGAGDVFLAAMLATVLQPSLVDGLEDPITLAAAAASLTVEGPGLHGVPDLAAVRRRATRAPSLARRRPSAASSPGSGRPSQA